MRNVAIESFLRNPCVRLSDVATMLLAEERARFPLPADASEVSREGNSADAVTVRPQAPREPLKNAKQRERSETQGFQTLLG